MSRSIGIAHIVREADRSANGVWGLFQIRSAFQPIYSFHQGRLALAAFEGLARPFRDGQPVSPGRFFGMVPAPDRGHVETLLRTVHLLNAGTFLPREAALFINFDPSVLSDQATVDTVMREMRLVLHEAEIDPARIVCEITEQRLSSASSLLYFLSALREMKIRVAVDDFGADDSDTERVRSVRPDIVKFDAKWINRLMASGPGFDLLAAMMRAFSGQGVVTLLEGIEEGWQLELAERAGARMVQGFAIRRPELVPTSFAVQRAEPARRDDAPAALPAQSPVPTLRAGRKAERAFGRRGA